MTSRTPPVLAALAVATATLTVTACTSSTPEPEPLVIETTAPDSELTVVDSDDALEAALRASALVFQAAPVAFAIGGNTADGNTEEQLRRAEEWGAPVFPLPDSAEGAPAEKLDAELDRLGTEQLFVPGEVDEQLEAFGDDDTVVAAFDESIEHPERGTPQESVQVLDAGDEQQAAARATLTAAGARVTAAGEQLDPQRSPDLIEALSTAEAGPIVALGAGYAEQAELEWKIASARTGAQLPGGGQRLFPEHTMVALYGTPGYPVLGQLGEQDLEASIDRARSMADQFSALTDEPVVPAFEIIATVASSSAGADGDYSNELDPATLEPWVERAGEEGMYVIIDLQPGRTDFLTQAKRYESLLRYPWVGLALDPEWRLQPDERHLVQIGSVTADEINTVVDWMAELTHSHDLPPKLLVLHQFRLDMIENRHDVNTSRPEVPVLIHADGQGGQGAKQGTWRALHDNAPENITWGWKNFVDEDQPMLTPEQTMTEVDPVPDLITYQ